MLTPNKSQTLYCGLNNLYLSNIYNPTHTALRFTQAILASLWLDYSNSTRAPFPPLPSAFPFPGFNCELLLHLAVNAVDYVAKIHNALAPNDIYYNIQQSAGNDPSTTSLKETGGLVGRARDTQNFIIDHIRDGKSIIAYSIILLSLVSLIVYLSRLVIKLRTSERVLKERFSLARAMCDGTPNPTYIRDRQGLLLDCNKAYLDTLRLERHKAIQKNIITTTYFHESPEQAQALHNEYLTVMATGLPSTFDHVTQTSDGQEVTINYWIRPYKGIDNTILGIIAGWDDVSEYRRLLTELSEAKKNSDDANLAKSGFLATMSHEIRTPMNAVLGLLELALKKANQGIVDRISLEVAFNAAHELLDLIGDILDISRIESGRLFLNPSRTSLKKPIENVFRVFENSARKKGLKLILEYDIACESDIMLDSLRFKQIISNLLSNAIKFTNTGEVRITVSGVEQSDKNSLSLQIMVSDTGIGISEEDQASLFDPYVQACDESHSNQRGSGLGLTICRTLCEMMGGHLRLQSRLGSGTSVEIALEVAVLPDAPTTDKPLSKSAQVTEQFNILVVDDYPANRLLISHQLGYFGHQVIDVENGVEALDEWHNGNYDIVITDCNMPLMNGYDLSRAIRAEEYEKGYTPCVIIGLTANAQPDEKVRCIEAGMDVCLFKPISLDDLTTSLGAVTKPSQTNATITLAPTKPQADIDLTNLQMMTAGDDTTILGLLSELINSNEEDMSHLTTLYLAYDLSGLSDLAHRIKGGARIIKANHLIRCCEQLEAACIEYDSVRLLNAMEVLQTAMQQLATALRNRVSN